MTSKQNGFKYCINEKKLTILNLINEIQYERKKLKSALFKLPMSDLSFQKRNFSNFIRKRKKFKLET